MPRKTPIHPRRCLHLAAVRRQPARGLHRRGRAQRERDAGVGARDELQRIDVRDACRFFRRAARQDLHAEARNADGRASDCRHDVGARESRRDRARVGAVVDATLQLGIGPVTVTVESTGGKPEFVWMAHREPEFGAKRDDRGRIATALGITAAGHSRRSADSDRIDRRFLSCLSRFAPSTRSRNALPTQRRSPALFKPGEQVLAYIYVRRERVGRVRSAIADVRAA